MPNIALIVNNILSDSGVPITYSTSGTGGTSGSSGTSGTSGSSGTSASSGSSGTSGTKGTSGTSGLQGTSGTSGLQGTSGTSGANGANGSSGTSGTKGTSGTSGANGANGSSGTSGANGAAGSSGTSGANGANGSSGTSGTKGTSGTSGANGSSGTSGANGAAGSSGTSGANGAAGSSGTSGTKGTSGTSGANGAAGSSGTSGTKGTSGTAGTSGSSGAGTISGTTNTVAKFTAATTIGNSNITDDGTTITLASNTTVNGSFKFYIRSNQSGYGQIQIGATTAGGEASLAFVGGVSSGLGTSGPTSGDGTGAVWAIGSNVYSIGTTVFGIGNASAGTAVFKITSAGAATITGSVTAAGALFTAATETRGNIRTTFPTDNSYYSLFSNDGALTLDTYGVGGYINFKILGSTKLTIASTGAATFSSSVTAATDVTLSNGILYVSAGSGTSYTSRLSTAYTFPYIDTYLDSFAGASYEGRLNFRTNSAGGAMSTKMTILNSGNVGIGNTPNKKLEVSTGNGTTDGIRLTYGSGVTAEGLDITYLNTGNTTTSFDSLYNSDSAIMRFRMKTAATAVTAMTILGNGNILVGTTSENSFGAGVTSIQMNGSSGSLLETRYATTSALRVGSSSDNCFVWNPMNVYMRFGTNDTERMRITSGGNVGINTSAPDVTFHVNGKSYIGTMTNYTPAVHIRGAYYGGPRLQVYGLDADANGWMGLGTDMSSGAYEFSIYYPTNASSSVCFGRYDGTATQYGGFTATARLSNAGTWTVAGDVVAYGSPSDVSLKQNIKPIEDALEKVLELEGVSFDWIEETEVNSLTGIKEDLGFIAQQVQQVIPKLVRENSNGKLSLRDKGITPYLVEAIKEQQKQIEELKTLINGFTS